MFKTHAAKLTDAKQAKRLSRSYSALSLASFVGLAIVSFGIDLSNFGLDEANTFWEFGLRTILPNATLAIAGGSFGYGAKLYFQRSLDIDAQTLHDNLLVDEGASSEDFILYLRSFDSTDQVKKTVTRGSSSSNGSSSSTTYELEDQLLKASKALGQFVALGQSLETTGAGRIKTSDEEWQKSADALMQAAKLIVMMPVTNPGTLWEVNKILNENMMPKTVFLNAESKLSFFKNKNFNQKDDWPKLQDKFSEFGYILPKFRKSGRMYYYGHGKTPVYDKDFRFESDGHLRDFMKRAIAMSNDPELKPKWWW